MFVCRLIRRSRASCGLFVFRICPYYTNGCAYIKVFSHEWKTAFSPSRLSHPVLFLTQATIVESLPHSFVSFLTPEIFTSLFLTDELIGLTSSVNPFSYHFHIYLSLIRLFLNAFAYVDLGRLILQSSF